jgi:MATE family multidrug resistance protein
VAGVAYAIPAALAQAAMVRMARSVAIGDQTLRRSTTFGALGLSLAAGIGVSLGLAAVSTPLATTFFGPTPAGLAAAGVAAGLILLLGAMEFMVNPGAVAGGLLRGRKDTRMPMVFTLSGYWAVGAPLGVYLCEVRDLGVTGIWIGLSAGATATTLLMLGRLFKVAGSHEARPSGS